MAQSSPPQNRGKAKVMQTIPVMYGFKVKPPGDLMRVSRRNADSYPVLLFLLCAVQDKKVGATHHTTTCYTHKKLQDMQTHGPNRYISHP
jgi:hypothetical protein